MRKLPGIILVLIIFCWFAAPAVAGGGGAPAKFDAMQFITALINFAIFIWLIVKFGGPGIKAFYKGRADEQLAAVKEAEDLITQTRALHDEITERKNNLAAETAKMVEDAKRRAQEQADEILAAASEQAEKIVEDAKRTITTEFEASVKNLKSQMVGFALETAEATVSKKLDNKGQKQLFDKFMNKLEDLQ